MPSTFTFDLPSSPGCAARPCGVGNRVFLLLKDAAAGKAADGSGVLIGEIQTVTQVNLTLWRYTVTVPDGEMAEAPAAEEMELFLSCIGAESEALLKKLAVMEGGAPVTPPTPPVLAERLCLAYVADVGQPGADLTNVVDTITDFGAEYVLDAGDNNYLGGDPAAWAGFAPWIGTQKYLRVRGNHSLDTPTEIANDAAAFPYLFTDSQPWWKRVVGNGLVEVFGIETGKRSNGTFISGGLHQAGGAQYLWLEAQLKASTARHKLVMFHHPPVSTGDDAGHDVMPEMAWEILSRADAILCGHVHLSEWLVWRGLPVINFSGAVQRNGTSAVRTVPAGAKAYPIFINDIDPLVGRLWVTESDVVVEAVNTRTRRVEFARSIYEKAPRATRISSWVYPQGTAVETTGAYDDFILAVPGHAMRVHGVTLSTGEAAGDDGSSYSVELLASGAPITNQIPIITGRVSGLDILNSRIPADAVIVARVRGWTAYTGTPARGLWIDIAGDSYH